MASTVLPNGIIIPEKYSRDWYADLYHNWQELDNLLGGGGGGANDGTLTIQKNGATVTTFSANQATDATANIEVPTKTSDLTNDSNFVPSTDLATVATSGNYNDLDNKPTIPTVNNATLTIQCNGTTVDTFTANASVDKTININTADDTKIPLAGSNQISGSLIPSTDNSIDIGSSTKNIKTLYTKGITIDAKTIDTNANGDMTYDSHIVDTIEEQGNSPDDQNNYIRYSSGLQICWGYVGAGSQTTKTFPKSFSVRPSVSVTVDSSDTNSRSTAQCTAQAVTIYNSIGYYGSFYIAIGMWK